MLATPGAPPVTELGNATTPMKSTSHLTFTGMRKLR